jgi:hypothetical protein
MLSNALKPYTFFIKWFIVTLCLAKAMLSTTVGYSEDLGFSTVFKPDFDDLQEAFLLLMKSSLIKPLMIFEGKTRYLWIDERLNELMQNLRLLHELEDEYFHFRSYFHDKPTYEEKKRLEFFGGKTVATFFINNAELSRFDLKKGLNVQIQKIMDVVKSDWKKKEEVDKEVDRQRQKINYIAELLKQEYSETIKKYPFLREIVSLVHPGLLQ